MAFRALLVDRNWYCILQYDAISAFKQHLFDTWWDSLTPEQQDAYEKRQQELQEAKQREIRTIMAQFATIGTMIANLNSSHAAIESHFKDL